MNSKRILITGGSGLLALNWACAMRGRHEVMLATHLRQVTLSGTTSQPVALDRPEQLEAQLKQLSPGLIVHTAGLTSVDQCEREPGKAHQANAILARSVAVASARLGLGLIHISTDHLFAGTRALYGEDDPPEPLNVYARTKLLAEQWVLQAHPDALVVRTNFFGWGHRYRQSFSDWIINSLRKGESLTLFEDAFFTPILAERLAASAHHLLDRGLSGIFNVVGDERVSKFEFALRLARHFELPEALVHRGKLSQSGLTAQRPPDMSLDNTKARNSLGAGLGPLDEHFAGLRHQQALGRPAELMQAVSAG